MFRNKLGCYIFRVCNWIYTHKQVKYTKPSILMPQNQWNKKCHHITGYPHISLLAAGFGFITYSLCDMKYVVYADDSQDTRDEDKKANLFDNNLPTYSTSEVSKHSNYKERIWVTYKNGVYDVTDFIHEHPGGDQILMAAGGAVDPFWMLYSVHLNPHVLNILEKYRIGNLDPKENNDNTSDMSDPYSNEPKRHVILKPACVKPFNAESPEQLLVENFITPNELFYVRNHLPVPDIDSTTYSLEIEIEGKSKTLTLTLDELKKFPKYSVTATVMCAGNRRSEMTKIKPVKGLNWGAAAVGNATWSGASLREVLKKAGLNEKDLDKYKHVQFEAFDTDATGSAYGASIPIWKAVDRRGDVILAYEMNGVPLPRDHGFPVRVIVPGVVGARNVKWLGR
ncbi:hypothetical protein WA026_005738 [Henosepilachna vigintioctopunctata]|uniref:sulfite oxidase n=1 Tax=Henosepilachna vigintioctopunctata TaxID=420089 RepID=A0AAW1U2Q4_9CUCU